MLFHYAELDPTMWNKDQQSPQGDVRTAGSVGLLGATAGPHRLGEDVGMEKRRGIEDLEANDLAILPVHHDRRSDPLGRFAREAVSIPG